MSRVAANFIVVQWHKSSLSKYCKKRINQVVQSAIHILEFWALAFVTLCAALVLLNIFFSLIGNGLVLYSPGKEAIIAGVASLVEGASVWVVLSFIPTAARALIIPALIVGIIYKLSHVEDWSRYEIFALLMFQTAISVFFVELFFGKFEAAIITLAIFVAALAVIAVTAKSL